MLTQADVGAMMIAAQGLDSTSKPAATKEDVLNIIRQMHVLQIDTINVVARSPYFVLWSRLGDYDPRWLDELLAEGKLFEWWAHAACFIPIEDYPFYRRLYLDKKRGWWGQSQRWMETHVELINDILMQIETNGVVRSADFKRSDGKIGNWWNWKDEKVALEYLHTSGVLMIAKRHNFQRLYDLRERILPQWEDAQAPSYEEVQRVFALNTVKALGVTKAAWVADYFRMPKPEMVRVVKHLAESGELQRVAVEGWDVPGYVHPDNIPMLEKAANKTLPTSKTTLLSPFDPLVWDRTRALELFRFDYKIECYTPAPKRKYGYFTLPILYNNVLIGRLDAKAHRKEKLFEVRVLHLEPDVEATDELIASVASALRECAAWHKTPEVVVRLSNPPEVSERLSQVLN